MKSFSTNVVVVIFMILINGSSAWKPIASSTAFTTSFSLKQSHPDLAAKAPDSAEVSSSASSSLSLSSVFPAHDTPILAAGPAGALTDSTKEALSSTPIAFKFDKSDSFAFGYSGSLIPSSDYPLTVLPKRCAVKKFAFNHDGTVEYEHDLPELKQFTICFWSRFTNHSGDHVILTYSNEHNPRELQFWVANAMNSSFISMAIKGQQIYRLNYPLRMRQWHHTCSSWNGKTGEWQVWMKAERIGRGFHNALVGHSLPANGKLFSGGPSMTGDVSQGLHFEITFVQVYRIALSAGKAHRNHKHHHVHQVDHEGQELSTTTRAPPMINRPQPMNSLLANGQIPTRVRINLAQPPATSAASSPTQFGFTAPIAGISTLPTQAATIHTHFVNGQINSGSRLVAQQLLGLQGNYNFQPQISQAPSNDANIQFVDETETHIFFKRQAESRRNTKNTTKLAKAIKSTRDRTGGGGNDEKIVKKRELVFLNDKVIVDNAQHGLEGDYTFDGLAGFGDNQFKHDLSTRMNIEDEISEHDHEPAEDEVKAVMTLCSACDPEPFQGAIVFAWKNVRESMDNVLKGNSVGGCGDF